MRSQRRRVELVAVFVHSSDEFLILLHEKELVRRLRVGDRAIEVEVRLDMVDDLGEAGDVVVGFLDVLLRDKFEGVTFPGFILNPVVADPFRSESRHGKVAGDTAEPNDIGPFSLFAAVEVALCFGRA